MNVNQTEIEDPIALASDTPEVEALLEEFKRCSPIDNSYNRIRDNDRVRFNIWEGQSPDGKKYDRLMPQGDSAFPWDGASDARPLVIDDVIEELAARESVAFWRALLKVQGVEATDLEAGANATKLMEWIVRTKQMATLVDEVELHSQYMFTYGWSVLWITWEREHSLKRITVKWEDVERLAQEAGQQEGAPAELRALPHLMRSPELDEDTAELVSVLWPDITKKRARKAIKALREDGTAEVVVRYLCKNEPAITVLKPWDEVCISGQVTDIQHARVFVRRWFTEVQLKEKIFTEDWDEEWVEAACKQKGQYADWRGDGSEDGPIHVSETFQMTDTKQDLIEVLFCYYRALDEDNVPAVYETILHTLVTKSADGKRLLYAKHGPLDYKHGKMPFVVRRLEKVNRQIVNSRGVPEIARTWERSIKVQEDAVTDFTSISVLPPVTVPEVMGVDYVFGPATQIPVRGPGREPKFMDVPTKGAAWAVQMIEIIERRLDRRFGRLRADVPVESAVIRQQRWVNGNLASWLAAFNQQFHLAQQFMSPEEIQRITGGAFPTDLEAIGRSPDLMLSFDVRETSQDWIEAKFRAIKDTVIPLDTAGRIDRAKLVEVLLRSIDPSLARELMVDQSTASQQLFDRVQSDLALMFLGNEPQFVEMDPTAPTKLQFAQQILAKNPKYQAAAQQDESFQNLLRKYEQNLSQSIKQEQNKQVGRIGVKPEEAL